MRKSTDISNLAILAVGTTIAAPACKSFAPTSDVQHGIAAVTVFDQEVEIAKQYERDGNFIMATEAYARLAELRRMPDPSGIDFLDKSMEMYRKAAPQYEKAGKLIAALQAYREAKNTAKVQELAARLAKQYEKERDLFSAEYYYRLAGDTKNAERIFQEKIANGQIEVR